MSRQLCAARLMRHRPIAKPVWGTASRPRSHAPRSGHPGAIECATMGLIQQHDRALGANVEHPYTLGVRHPESADGKKGSIAPGQPADLALLSADYFAPEEQITRLESVLTVVEGRVVHGSGDYGYWLQCSRRSARPGRPYAATAGSRCHLRRLHGWSAPRARAPDMKDEEACSSAGLSEASAALASSSEYRHPRQGGHTSRSSQERARAHVRSGCGPGSLCGCRYRAACPGNRLRDLRVFLVLDPEQR